MIFSGKLIIDYLKNKKNIKPIKTLLYWMYVIVYCSFIQHLQEKVQKKS